MPVSPVPPAVPPGAAPRLAPAALIALIGVIVAAVSLLGAPWGAAAPAAAHPSSPGEPPGEAREEDEGRGGESHEITLGETLWLLARRYHVTIQALVALNGIADPDRIVAGDVITIPADGSSPAAGSSGGGQGSGERLGAHVVAPGETLSAIASRYDLPVDALAAANGIVDTDTVWVGSRLVLAAHAPALPEPAGAATHVVQRGETLSEIALAYGTSLTALAEANGIADPDRVIEGTTLSVPGSWRCPVPAVTRLVNDFGAPRHGGRYHEGIDLFAARGESVEAPVAGTVSQTEGRRGGLQFRLAGDDGHTYIGTHLETLGASGRVSSGEVLGTVGTSGNAAGTDPHLHFEMHVTDGPTLNPYPVLVRACGV